MNRFLKNFIIAAAVAGFAATAATAMAQEIQVPQQAMTLKECMEYAVSNSTKMRIQQADTRDAQVERRSAILEAFTPSVSAGSYAYYNFGRSVDPETNTYSITETIRIEETAKGISIDPETGAPQSFDCPVVIEMREGVVTISEDGKLLKFVCDYSQSMDMHGYITTTMGLTSWTFSDYGTTVIE